MGGVDLGPLRLNVSVYNGNWSYDTVPVLMVTTSAARKSERLWTPPSSISQPNETLILCLTPFVFVLTTAERSELWHNISDWTLWSVDRRPRGERHIAWPTADRLQGGIRAMVYPADYRVA
jgi:hypothetical protein